MIGVLLFSRSPRKSSWAAVRGSKEIRVTGMKEKDLVKIKLKGNGHEGVEFISMSDDCSFNIPDDVEAMMAEHVEASGSDVCVEMH